SRDYAVLEREIAAALGSEDAAAARIVADPTGEALALTLIAIGMPTDQAARVLMFAVRLAGESIEAMRRLVECLDGVPRAAATRIVRAMAASASRQSAARHEAVFADTGAPRGKSALVRRERLAADRGRRLAT